MAYHLKEYFLSVGHESDMKGRGVMAIQDIPFGCVVANYEGELIRSDVMYKSYDWLGLIFWGGAKISQYANIFPTRKLMVGSRYIQDVNTSFFKNPSKNSRKRKTTTWLQLHF